MRFASGLSVEYKSQCGVRMIPSFGVNNLKYEVVINCNEVDLGRSRFYGDQEVRSLVFRHVKFDTFSMQMEIWIQVWSTGRDLD